MKVFLFFIALFCGLIDEAVAAPQLGITPCSISQQPADLSFSASSSNVKLSTCGETLIVFNNSTSDARFRIGSGSGTTALTSDMLLAQKTFVVLNVSEAGLYFAAIGAGGGSGTISFIQGQAGN